MNKADAFIEENKLYLGGKVLGVLLNPEMETYTGEDFEKVTIHYYKALNYMFLNKLDEALVEAKRINLQLQEINDKYPEGKKNRYTSDGFALNMQGFLYEATGDVNNAFISYRNAVNLYLENNGSFFGTPLPDQLKKDVLRTAASLGFLNELERYQKLLDTTYVLKKENKNGELIQDKKLRIDASGYVVDDNNLAFHTEDIKIYGFNLIPYPQTKKLQLTDKDYELEILFKPQL